MRFTPRSDVGRMGRFLDSSLDISCSSRHILRDVISVRTVLQRFSGQERFPSFVFFGGCRWKWLVFLCVRVVGDSGHLLRKYKFYDIFGTTCRIVIILPPRWVNFVRSTRTRWCACSETLRLRKKKRANFFEIFRVDFEGVPGVARDCRSRFK